MNSLISDPRLRKFFLQSFTNDFLKINPNVFKQLGFKDNKFVMELDLPTDLVLKGRIQEGKTNCSIDTALRAVFELDKHVIMIVDNYTTMLDSFMNRFQHRIEKYFSGKKSSVNINHYIVNTSTSNQNNILQLFSGTQKYIFLCIGNAKCLSKVFKAYNDSFCDDFYLIVDESDLLATSTTNSGRSQIIAELKKHSIGSAFVSGTPYTSLILNNEEVLLCKDVKYLPENPDYVSYGHKKFKFKCLDKYGVKGLYMGNRDKLTKEEVQCLYKIYNLEEARKYKDTLITVNIGGLKKQFKEIEKKTIEYYGNTIIVRMYDGKIEVVTYRKGKVVDKFCKSGLSLQQNLLKIQQEKSKKKRRFIVIIGNKQITRGQSLRSEIAKYNSYKDILYCQALVVDLSDTRAFDETMQTVFRAGGVFKGQDEDFKGVRIYTNRSIRNEIKRLIKWETNSDTAIKDKNNAYRNVLDVIQPFKAPEKPKRKITSKQSGYYKSMHLSDKLHYPTQEKLRIDVEHAKKKKQNQQQEHLLKEGTITKRIYDVLVINKGKYMTPREVYNVHDDKKLWGISSETPFASISKLLLDLHLSGKIEKTDGPKYRFN